MDQALAKKSLDDIGQGFLFMGYLAETY